MIMRQNFTETNYILTEIQPPINQNEVSVNLVHMRSEKESSFTRECFHDNRDDVELYDTSSPGDEEKENFTEPDERDGIFPIVLHPHTYSSKNGNLFFNQNGKSQFKIINHQHKYEKSNDFNYLINNDYLKIGSSLKNVFSSKIYAAIDSKTLSIVSLKEIQVNQDMGYKEMESEILCLKSQMKFNCDDCKNIVKYHGVFYSENRTRVSIVSEYLRFGSLQHWIEHGTNNFFNQNIVHKYDKNPVIFPEKLDMFNWLSSIGNDILNGLCYLHSKYRMVHLDIRPENILIADDGRALISSFGSSKQITFGEPLFDQGDIDDLPTSSALFMSPERLKQEKFCGIKSDVWSLGMTLLACVLRESPMEIEDLIWTIQTCNGDIKNCLEKLYLPKDMTDFLGICFRAEVIRPSSCNLVSHNFFTRSQLWGDLEWRQMKTWWPRQSNIGKELRNVHSRLERFSNKEFFS